MCACVSMHESVHQISEKRSDQRALGSVPDGRIPPPCSGSPTLSNPCGAPRWAVGASVDADCPFACCLGDYEWHVPTGGLSRKSVRKSTEWLGQLIHDVWGRFRVRTRHQYGGSAIGRHAVPTVRRTEVHRTTGEP